MVESIVSFTVERLGDLLISEAKLLHGVNDQVEEIKAELKRMQCFLKDADIKQGAGGDNRICNWVVEIRRLAHRTEDVIETYALEVASKRNQGISTFKKILRRFACIVREGKALHKVGLEIQTIKGNLSSITNSLQSYGIKALEEGESSNTKQQVSRISYSHLLERDFVGMEKDIEQMVSHLKSKDCEVVSIWGMGGQGKTTLATKIYNHTVVQTYFQAFAWVCITQQFQREKVLQDILKQLLPGKEGEGEISSMEEAELVRKLYKIQKEKTCLVVIDDIWKPADWASLRPAFPIGETTTSKILLTTRIRKVADVGILHKLQPLSDEEGLKLLLRKAFSKIDDIPEERVKSEMEEIGRDMVRRCQGLPLAISTLGGILKDKVYREWEMINKDITSYLVRGDGVEDDENHENRTVRGVLSLSYDNLPPRLRHSFLYLGNFKEDEIISTELLYLLWIAEGMVSLEDRAEGEMMLDVAERYLGELAQRSLVQVEPTELKDFVCESYSWLKFKTCSVHDLVRDVCLSKGKEQDFLNVIDLEHNHDDLLLNSNSTSTDSDLARRLCIRSFDDTTRSSFVPFLQQQQHATRKLRSLLLFPAYYGSRSTDFPKEILSLQLLRVLKLTRIDFRNVGHAGRIGELVYLKYLSFADYCYIDEIPSSIGNLRNLQTLDLRVDISDVTIPNVLWKLKQLQHLYLPYLGFKVNEVEKLRFDGLSELELLDNFRTSVCDVNDILKLRKLQVLRGHIDGSLVDDLQGIISSITSRHLRYSDLCIGNYGRHFDSELEEGVVSPWRLLLECPFLNGLRIEAPIGVLPMGEYRFSQSLTSMDLFGCELEEDPMIILEKIPKLQYLTLRGHSYVGKKIVCSAFGFPQLRILTFISLQNLVEWRVDEGAMPNLSKLTIRNCDGLKMLPDGLRFLSTLRK